MKIQLKVNGMEEMKSALDKAPELVIDESSKAIQKSILTIQNQAMKEAPVNKSYGGGNLRQNIRYKMLNKLSGIVESLADYSIYVHEGTRAHIIRVKNKKTLANVRANQFFGPIVNHPGTKPNRFFERAIQNSENKINSFFQTALNNVLKIFPK